MTNNSWCPIKPNQTTTNSFFFSFRIFKFFSHFEWTVFVNQKEEKKNVYSIEMYTLQFILKKNYYEKFFFFLKDF